MYHFFFLNFICDGIVFYVKVRSSPLTPMLR
jgi:hypothetical protein